MISMFLLRVFCPLLFENDEKEFCLFFFYRILAQSNLQIFLHWKTPPQRREGGQLCGFFCPMASIRSARCYILQIFRPKERWIEPIILHKMATNKKSGKARPTTMWIHVLIFTVGCIMFCKGRGCNIFLKVHTQAQDMRSGKTSADFLFLVQGHLKRCVLMGILYFAFHILYFAIFIL